MPATFSIPLTPSLTAFVETFGGPLAHVTFRRVALTRAPTTFIEPALGAGRLDLDKHHFIDELPGPLHAEVQKVLEELVDQIDIHLAESARGVVGSLY